MKSTIAALFSVMMVNFAVAQTVDVPVEQQYSLFMKMLSFDKNLKDRAGNEIIIGILYQNNFKFSLDTKDNLMKAFNTSSVKDINKIPVRFTPIDIDEVTDLSAAVTKYAISVFYVTPLRAAHLSSIIGLARARQIRTITGVPEYVNSGLALGIGAKGGKPLILVNLSAAKMEGANLNSQLLKLAKIIE
jgi:hypothetical protein